MSAHETPQLKILDPALGHTYPDPRPETVGSAAIDLRAMNVGGEPLAGNALMLPAGETVKIGTGIAIYIGRTDRAGLIIPRSGIGNKHGLVLGNGTGLVDSDYQGEVMVSLHNRNRDASKEIHRGDRIAQLFLIPVIPPVFELVSEFAEATARGAGGFGSTDWPWPTDADVGA